MALPRSPRWPEVVRIVHQDTGREAHVPIAAYRHVWYDAGWRSPDDDPDWSGGGPGQGPTFPFDADQIEVAPISGLTAGQVQEALVELTARTGPTVVADRLRVAQHPLLDDFLALNTVADGIGNPAYGWEGTVANSGTIGLPAFEPSVVQLSTGATTDGSAEIASANYFVLALPVFTMRWRVQRQAISGGATNNGYTVTVGARDAAGIAPDAMFGVRVTVPSTGASTLEVVVHDNNNEATDSPTEHGWDAAGYHEVEITCDGNNLLRGYVDGVFVGEVEPETPSNFTFVLWQPFASITKDSSSNSGERALKVDYLFVLPEASRG